MRWLPLTSRSLHSLLVSTAAVCLTLACGDPSPPTAEPKPKPVVWQQAFDAQKLGWLLSVWGTSETNLYAAGGQDATDDTDSQGLLMHFDGDRWQAVELPEATPLLNWTFGFGDQDVTVVGNQGTILHFDGDHWEQQPTPTEQNLWGVWGAAADDVWAVGGRGRADGEATLLHYDGSEWTLEPMPEMERSGVNALFKVWGTGPDNVIAVGQRGGVIQWNGEKWQERLVGASDDLIALWGTGPDDIIAVGGRSVGIVSRFDGNAWHTYSLAPTAGLNGVWFDSQQIHIGGVSATLGVLDLTEADAPQFIAEEADTAFDVHAVFGVGKHLYAVGGNFLQAVPPFRGLALERQR